MALTHNDIMPFGKYRGKRITNVPASYLRYIYDNNYVTVFKYNPIYHYIKENLDVIDTEIERKRQERERQAS